MAIVDLFQLDTTYASLGGGVVCCVKFLGIATFNLNSQDKNKSKMPIEHGHESKINADRKIYLVFEKASQGTLLRFLSSHLQGLDFIKCWDRLVDCLLSIATGINVLHKHGVLHR